ncbi:MAG: UDP-N-acetylmuramoyl-L-alanine--D-glutamate ligase [Rikenellaceae bacterium]|nr:UDP-N-acetylmuramoyl-L-alanine--D-glutamate ligase [Rikenellaceae bacterium]
MMKIAVLGGGQSGLGSAVLARKEGFEVFLSDSGRLSDQIKASLQKEGIPFEEGGHTMDKILDADEVIKSPGIPETAPVMKEVRKKGIPVISEIEFGGRYSKARHICITGSNGKTTTTTLVYELLKAAGLNVGVGGNIGLSYAYQVATCDYDWYVLELSSFQLDDTFTFRSDVAVLTNITPDHLDRYDYRIENYVDSKFRIIRNQRPDDFFIYSVDDALTMKYVCDHQERMTMRSLPFTVKDTLLEGAYIDNGMMNISCNGREFLFDPSRMQIKGRHNIYNAMAAVMAAMIAGVDDDTVTEVLCSFGGVEHRMEVVDEIGGVLYVNDSKATNVDSVWYALDSMTRPTVWIAGGTDKGNDYDTLKELARAKVRTLVCMGLDNDKLVKAFTGVVPFVYSTSSLDEAMEMVATVTHPGDCVLLSPACASFDLFKNYEDRGRRFKECVRDIEHIKRRAQER